jgi:hypothetical protein
MIGEVKNNTVATVSQTGTAQTQSRQSSAASQEEAEKSTDTVELGKTQSASVTYSKSDVKKGAVDVSALKAAADQRYESLRGLVEQMLNKQNEKTVKPKSFQSANQIAASQAKMAISEDGEFGVKATSDRIVKFAIAISGGDTAQYEKLKSAIDKGFQQATKSLGGSLPSISQQTYKEVMRKLDDWRDGKSDLTSLMG